MIRPVFLLLFSVVAFAQQYVISTFAGGVPPSTPTAANGVSIGDPPRVAADSAGNIYFGSIHSTSRVDLLGNRTRLAGTGRAGISGDGGPATSAQLNQPMGIAVHPSGAIYFAAGN